MSETNNKEIVEALIMASDDPLSLDKISKILNSNNRSIETKELRGIVNELINDYSNSALELKEVASGLRFQIKPDLSYWISKLHEERPPRYSRALLETLSLVAYRQPITRSEIEDVRGVGVSSNIVKTMLEHEWVKVVGYKEVPGRPALFATTKKFLDHFNLKHLNELPDLTEFTETIVDEFVDKNEEEIEKLEEQAQVDEDEEGFGEQAVVDGEELEEQTDFDVDVDVDEVEV